MHLEGSRLDEDAQNNRYQSIKKNRGRHSKQGRTTDGKNFTKKNTRFNKNSPSTSRERIFKRFVKFCNCSLPELG